MLIFNRVQLHYKHATLIFTALLTGFSASCTSLADSGQEESKVPIEAPRTQVEAKITDGEPLPVSPACSQAFTDLLPENDNARGSSKKPDGEIIIATYKVSGETITLRDLPPLPARYKRLQQDTALHEEIWALITNVIPGTHQEEVTSFTLFTDGIGGTLGAMSHSLDPQEWTIEMDIMDADDPTDLITTLIHETAHLLSLHNSQVETYLPLYENPDDMEAFVRGEEACRTYFLAEGCSHPGSYLNLFYERYWRSLFDEWQAIHQESKETKRENLLMRFYKRHDGEFVSRYAVTSPEEDIAETFLYYVLTSLPAGDNLAEQKILFFDEFPELASLRADIRTNLCTILIK